MLPTCAKCGRDTIEHRNPKIRHEFVYKNDTARDLPGQPYFGLKEAKELVESW